VTARLLDGRELASHLRRELRTRVEALNDPKRFGLGARHITVSTSGVVPGIRRLTELGPQFTQCWKCGAYRREI